MAHLQVIEATAPSAWAPFLINGDASGLDVEELQAAEAWVERCRLGYPVSCDDAGFRHYHDALPECPYSADCQTYVFLTDGEA